MNLIVEQLKQGLKDRENKAKTGKAKGLYKRWITVGFEGCKDPYSAYTYFQCFKFQFGL